MQGLAGVDQEPRGAALGGQGLVPAVFRRDVAVLLPEGAAQRVGKGRADDLPAAQLPVQLAQRGAAVAPAALVRLHIDGVQMGGMGRIVHIAAQEAHTVAVCMDLAQDEGVLLPLAALDQQRAYVGCGKAVGQV